MSTWIDFKQLRSKLDFEQVLKHYGIEVKRRGNQHHGFCPLPKHNGKKNSPSFSAHLERGIFQCFGCGAKGNVLEFAAMMSNVDPNDGGALREVAVELQQRLCPGFETPNISAQQRQKPQVGAEEAKGRAIIVNPSLDFELKGLDPKHPYLESRGLTPETIAHFGLGFCSRGLLKNRIVIPLHCHEGRLVGYAGRLVDDSATNEENPRYRFPSKRERDGKVIEFRKTRFLYNGFRIKEAVDAIIVVEGFSSVWWLHQNGLTRVVATMGADCSERQAELLVSMVRPSGRVWIMPDGDAAGERFAQSLLVQISPHRFARWIKLTEDAQPTDLSAEALTDLLQL
jgi:DNA primase